MIDPKSFAIIYKKTYRSIYEVFNAIRSISPEDYIFYLARGEYIEYPSFSNPYVIDYQLDRMRDHKRLQFLTTFMRNYYKFKDGCEKITNDEYRINLELMIYTHIWESKPFLKQLFRMAHILDSRQYKWEVMVPEMGKHKFISSIKDVFKNKKLEIASCIQEGYHSSLRNAFAHAEYSININDDIIELHNYKGKEWELPSISLNEWSKRFVYSVTLSYHLFNITHKLREQLPDQFGTTEFMVNLPQKDESPTSVKIVYDKEYDRFNFLSNINQ